MDIRRKVRFKDNNNNVKLTHKYGIKMEVVSEINQMRRVSINTET